MVRVMTDYRAIPELLEENMQPHGGAGLWLTVPEFRTYFILNERSSPAISGFFRRLYHRPFFTYPYLVTRIEKLIVTTPQTWMIKRYLLHEDHAPVRTLIPLAKRMIDHWR